MAIEIKGKIYRTPLEQIQKNKEDIQAITKDKTVTICTYNSTNDADPNIHTKFSGTITLIGDVVISVIGVIIDETITYPVVEFTQPNISKVIRISGYSNQLIDIDIHDFDDEQTYPLY